MQPETKAEDQDCSRISTERVDSNPDRTQNKEVSTICTSKYLKRFRIRFKNYLIK